MRRFIIATALLLVFSLSGRTPGDTPAEGTICPVPGGPSFEARLHAIEMENGCLDAEWGIGVPTERFRGAGAPGVNLLQSAEPASWPPGWDKASIVGGDVAPIRVVSDPYPTLHSVVVDAERNKVFMSDPNRHALWSYDRLAASKGKEMIEPLTGIRGPATGMMFIAAVTIDREAQEIYTVDNDIGDRMMVFPYDAAGNVKPKRVLEVPHQAWGLSISAERNELAISVESSRQIVIYRKGAEGREQPLRTRRGPTTVTARSASSDVRTPATSRRSAPSRDPGPASSGRWASRSTRKTTKSGSPTTATTPRSSSRALRRATSRPNASFATRRPVHRPSASGIQARSRTTRSATRSWSLIESASRESRRLPGWQAGTRIRPG